MTDLLMGILNGIVISFIAIGLIIFLCHLYSDTGGEK